MALTPTAFTNALLLEARETHPWLHHPLFHMIWDGKLGRAQLQSVIRQQGCFFLDTLRHAAWKIISVGGYSPTFEDLERQRALIPLVVEEGGEDTVGGKTTAHAFLFIKLAEALGISRDALFATDYLPTTIIEKNELFLLQRSSTVEALCGGNIATESLNATHVQRMADALERHYGVARAALDFYHVHMEVEGTTPIAPCASSRSSRRPTRRRPLGCSRCVAPSPLDVFALTGCLRLSSTRLGASEAVAAPGGVREGAPDHAARARCSAAAGLHPGARRSICARSVFVKPAVRRRRSGGLEGARPVWSGYSGVT